jgi:four helix bundle protein
MTEKREERRYDLEERTLAFSKRAVKFCRSLPRTVIDSEMGKQLVRSSTSVGANYIEANECLGKKDFLMRIRICRKEAKESGYWLKLLEPVSADLRDEHQALLQESVELTRIFGSIISRSDTSNPKPQVPNSKH